MKLYFYPKTRATRPRWMLEELGVPYEIVTVDLKNGANYTADFLKINPFGGVPAFEDQGQTFFESAAIVAYLADKFPEKQLAPPLNSPERATYLQWMFFASTTLDKFVADYFFHTSRLAPDKRIPQYAEICKQSLSETLEVLNREISKSDYFVGDHFTAADILMGSNLLFAKGLGLLEVGQVNILAYCDRLIARPAYRRAIQ